MWLNNVIYENRVIEKERLELSARDSLYFLGRNLTLRRCTLVLGVPAQRLHVNDTRIMECTIEVRARLKNFQWSSAHLKGCRFKGRFIGNDFGSWSDKPTEASIEDCDFTEAHLQGCRFLQCDVRTLSLPRWPYFTLLDAGRRALELGAVPWPGTDGPIIGRVLAQTPPDTQALSYSARDLAKFCGTTPEALKALIEKLDGVYY
ncbi:MAG: hypothetical protein ACJ8AT_00165 [Hyalangium sp.]|uniref:hypothetical protein n=1 Tax=Hyalangium sp. TaxID=2028555 RepID=UPI00389B3637